MKPDALSLANHQRGELTHELASAAVHEFSNLLTPVLVRADAARSSGDPAKMAAALDLVCDSVGRAVDVARRIMTLGSGRAPNREPRHVGDAIRQAIGTHARAFEKDGIQFELHADESLAVDADPVLFDQFVLNLILEARHSVRRNLGRIRVHAAGSDGTVSLSVRDNRAHSGCTGRDATSNEMPRSRLDASADIARWHGATFHQEQASDGEYVVTTRWPAAAAIAATPLSA